LVIFFDKNRIEPKMITSIIVYYKLRRTASNVKHLEENNMNWFQIIIFFLRSKDSINNQWTASCHVIYQQKYDFNMYYLPNTTCLRGHIILLNY
jgi:hypothetical protein